MKAVQLKEVGAVHLVDLPDPQPRSDEVVIRVSAAGMCGSDRHLVSGEYPGRTPVVLGHEFEGIVISGNETETVRIGDRVTVNPNIACGVCSYCVQGLVAHCRHLSAYGVDRDGGFAELVSVRTAQAHVLPATLGEHLGALCEPLSCCLRAIDRAEIRPGQRVAVIGGGVMGQLLVQLARLAGATEVILSTRQRQRRQLAESLGATGSFDPTDHDSLAAVFSADSSVPAGVDVVLEAAGAPGSFEQAIAIVRPAGTVVIVGAAPQQMSATIRPFEIFERELRIVGSHLNPFTHARSAELVSSGVLHLEPLITRVVGLEDLAAALQTAPAAGEVKVMMTP
jgi:L-iditol 2-dehydrogenase